MKGVLKQVFLSSRTGRVTHCARTPTCACASTYMCMHIPTFYMVCCSASLCVSSVRGTLPESTAPSTALSMCAAATARHHRPHTESRRSRAAGAPLICAVCRSRTTPEMPHHTTGHTCSDAARSLYDRTGLQRQRHPSLSHRMSLSNPTYTVVEPVERGWSA